MAMAMCLSLLQTTAFAAYDYDTASGLSIEANGDGTYTYTVTLKEQGAEEETAGEEKHGTFSAENFTESATYVDENGVTIVKTEKDATCTDPSKIIYTVKVGEKLTESVSEDGTTKALGHNYEGVKATGAPGTCKAAGNTTLVCNRCKESAVTTSAANENVHKSMAYTPEKEAAAGENGNVAYYTCNECNKVYRATNVVVTSEFTTADGDKITYNTDYYVTTGKEETVADMVIVYDNDAGTPEFKSPIVTKTNDPDTVDVEKTNAKLAEMISSETDGNAGSSGAYYNEVTKVYTYTKDNTVIYQSPTCQAEGFAKKSYTANGATSYETVTLAKVDHEVKDSDWTTKTAATCLNDLVQTGKCKWCGAVQTRTVEGTAKDHSFDATGSNPTQTKWTQAQKNAWTEFVKTYKTKVDAGTYLLKDGTTLKITEDQNFYVASTDYCEDQVTMAVVGFCTNAGHIDTVSYDVVIRTDDVETMAAQNIKDTKHPVALTVGVDGMTEHTHAKLLKNGDTVNETVENQAATCTTDGYAGVIKKCPYCAKVLDSSEAVVTDATGHKVNEKKETNYTYKYAIVWGTLEPGTTAVKGAYGVEAHHKNEFIIVPVCDVCGKPAVNVYDTKNAGTVLGTDYETTGKVTNWYKIAYDPESTVSETNAYYQAVTVPGVKDPDATLTNTVYVDVNLVKTTATSSDSASYVATVSNIVNSKSNKATAVAVDGSMTSTWGSNNINDDPTLAPTNPDTTEHTKHSFELTATTAATYTKQGTKTYVCSVCGETVIETTAMKKLANGKIKSLTAKKGKKVVVNFKKVTGAKKYRIAYSYNGKKWFLTDTTKTSITLKNLKAGKKLRVKVRAIAGSNKGSYSSVKKVTVKK